VLWTLFAIAALLEVLRTGLLGYPNLLVAGPMGFAPQTMFEADDASRAAPAVRL